MKIDFKKIASAVIVALVLLLFCFAIYDISPQGKLVDFSGFVDSVELNDDEKCVYVTATQDLSNAVFEIKIPYKTKCKTVSGEKFSPKDIKSGHMITLDFKGKAKHISGMNYATAKGTVNVAPLSNSNK